MGYGPRVLDPRHDGDGLAGENGHVARDDGLGDDVVYMRNVPPGRGDGRQRAAHRAALQCRQQRYGHCDERRDGGPSLQRPGGDGSKKVDVSAAADAFADRLLNEVRARLIGVVGEQHGVYQVVTEVGLGAFDESGGLGRSLSP